MKVFIGLALLSVAFATPLMPPITLPEVAQPALEGVELPPPVAPAYETPGALPTVDMSPAMIPQAIAEKLNDLKELKEMPVDPVRVVDNAEVVNPAPVDDQIAPAEQSISPVIIVDHVDETVHLEVVPTSELEADPVRVVDSPVEAGSEDRQVPEAPVEDGTEIKADAVIFVDNVALPSVWKRDTYILKAEPIEISRVIVADVLPLPEAEIIADPVRVVDVAPAVVTNADVVTVARVPVVFVQYPEKYYDSPLLR